METFHLEVTLLAKKLDQKNLATLEVTINNPRENIVVDRKMKKDLVVGLNTPVGLVSYDNDCGSDNNRDTEMVSWMRRLYYT